MGKILQTTKKFMLPGEEFGKIHGHTTIELTSVVDGSKKIIEHDNVFQNAVLAKYMRSLGYYNNNPYANSTWKGNAAWRNLVGGIFLFRDSIDLTGGDVAFMPAGNAMTANGSYGVTNSGNPTELGSYNNVESVIGDHSLTFVYDWDTSHGNGTISTVCLTSETGGYIGYGNPSGTAGGTRLFSANQSSNYYVTGNSQFIPQVYKNLVFKTVSIDTANGKVTIDCAYVPCDKMSIFAVQNEQMEVYYTGSLPSTPDQSFNHYTKICVDGDYLYIFPAYSGDGITEIGNGGSYTYIKVDLTARTAALGSFTNNTGRTIFVGFLHQLVADGVIYCPRYRQWSDLVNSDIDLIKLSDSSYVDTITAAQRYTYLSNIGAFTPGLIQCGRTDAHTWIYDTVNKTQYPTNAHRSILETEHETNVITSTAQAEDGIMGVFGTYYQTNVYSFKNPLYLATVNNLESPVVKSSTQTMKVTYTLTEAS